MFRSPGISKFQKVLNYNLLIGCLVAIAGVVFIGRGALAKQLNNWMVLPKPERLSELYFTDYRLLPASITTLNPQKVTFTVHNLEHQTTTYHFKLLASSKDNGRQRLLEDGSFTLDHDKSLITEKSVVLPLLSKRMEVKVELLYQGLASGQKSATVQNQSIDYLVNISDALLSTVDTHEAS